MIWQTFSKSCNITFQGRDGAEQYAHTTSWGISTRLIGGMIMTHGDDDGMIMPPRVAPHQVVILPFLKGDGPHEIIMKAVDETAAQLRSVGVRVHVDNRDMRAPDKMWDAVKKGVPLRVEIGSREAEEGQVTHVRRDLGRDSKTTESLTGFVAAVPGILDDIHDTMLAKAQSFMNDNIVDADSPEAVKALYADGHIGWARVDVSILEDRDLKNVMDKKKLSARCMPLADKGAKVLIGKAY